jgi:hypothetical protein
MANAWGELSWNAGNWGDQNNATVFVTGFENSIALNSVDLILIKDGVQIFGELRIGVKAET